MSVRTGSFSGRSSERKRRSTRRRWIQGFVVGCALFGAALLLTKDRTLRAQTPPAATLVSPDGTTEPIGKPFFVWNEEPWATDYRLKSAPSRVPWTSSRALGIPPKTLQGASGTTGTVIRGQEPTGEKGTLFVAFGFYQNGSLCRVA